MGKAVNPGAWQSKDKMARARRRYETTVCSFDQLVKRYHVSKTTLTTAAKAQGWKKFSPAITASQMEDLIWVESLRQRGEGPLAPTPIKRTGGRPRKEFLRMANASSETPEQLRLARAQADYETGRYSFDALAEKYGMSTGKLRYWAREIGWVKGDPPPAPAPAPPPAEASPEEKPPPRPESEVKGWSAVKATSDIKTADIIDFPSPGKPSAKIPEAIELLPYESVETKHQLRLAMSAIRASMSVEQVQRLARHTSLLSRYSHLLEVYMEPQRFADVQGLSPEERADRIVATQKVALRMLLPTDRDTLAGAVKTMTESLARVIGLERMVAGLNKVVAGAVPMADNPEEADSPLDLDALATEDLRGVQYAMEMLDRHHRRLADPPKPPPPVTIDDLLGPEAVVAKEPEGEPR